MIGPLAAVCCRRAGATPFLFDTTGNNNSAALAGVKNIQLASSILPRDIEIAHLLLRNANFDQDVTVYPPGWRALVTPPAGKGTSKAVEALAALVCAGEEDDTLVPFTIVGGVSQDFFGARCHQFRAGNFFEQFPIAGVVVTTGSSSPVIFPQMYAQGPNRLACLFTGFASEVTTVTDFGSGFTLRSHVSQPTGGTGSWGLQTAVLPSGASVTPAPFAFTPDENWVCVGLFLCPQFI